MNTASGAGATSAGFLNEAAVSELIGHKVSTLQSWRSAGIGPAYYKFGSKVRYASEDVAQYVAALRVPTLEQK